MLQTQAGRSGDDTVAGVVEEALYSAGVRHMPMIPGGPLMHFLQAVYERSRIKPLLVRHEVNAALMAEGYSRASGQLAAVAVTAGPGATNTTTGVAVAFREQTPLICISAQVSSVHRGRDAAQELDTAKLLAPITKASVELNDPVQAWSTVKQLIDLAQTAPKGPVHLSVPTNLWNKPCVRTGSNTDNAPIPSQVTEQQLRELTGLLIKSKAPVILLGMGAASADCIPPLQHLLSVHPSLLIASTPRAKGVFPETDERYLGCYGFSSDASVSEYLLEHADLIVVCGSRLGETSSGGWTLEKTRATIVQVDINPAELGRNVPIELGIAGDVSTVLHGVMRHLPSGKITGVSSTRQRLVSPLPPHDWQLSENEPHVHPIQAVNILERCCSDSTHIVCDIGNTMSWCIRYLRRRKPRTWHVNLVFGAMGYALPAAAGAALALQAPVVALVGDAALMMSCMELHTLAEHKLPVVVVVFNNSGHGMVDLGRNKLFPDSKIPNMTFDSPPDLASLARSMGVASARVSDAQSFERVLTGALGCGLPFLIDLDIDVHAEPPIGTRLEALTSQYGANTHTAR